ncbi:MAG: endonuclease III [Candidatus Omnitrophica bacterium]|nr:Endonuclease III [bacterium]NUN98448.1 endonuclease III [Candidatus Omnitrophota bacterium]
MAKAEKQRALEIVRLLADLYPDAKCALRHRNPFQLLIATILSAQCTDARVNEVTRTLFKKYPDPGSLAEASLEEIEEDIRPTGFFRNKAKNIQACCRALVEGHRGSVPAGMEELTRLAGVGRKTANVILGNCFGIPGIVVDTHVQRLSQRLALTRNTTPEKIEMDLTALIPAEEQVNFCHRMIEHGRQVCAARKPLCSICGLERVCPQKGVKGKG